MRKVALPLMLFAPMLLPILAFSQTTTSIQPGYCGKQIFNCILGTADGGRVWVDSPYFVNVYDSTGTLVSNCTQINAYSFQWAGNPPSRTNPVNVPFTLHVECGSGAVVLDESGYGYYSPYKYAGVYYHVDRGTVSY